MDIIHLSGISLFCMLTSSLTVGCANLGGTP